MRNIVWLLLVVPTLALGQGVRKQGALGANATGGKLTLSQDLQVSGASMLATLTLFPASDVPQFMLSQSNDVSAGWTLQADTTGSLKFHRTGGADGFVLLVNGRPQFPTLPTYADNTAAKAAGLANGTLYRTATGGLMVAY